MSSILERDKIVILLDPAQRATRVKHLLREDGLPKTRENHLSAYLPISLTNTSEPFKSIIKNRQELLIKCLEQAGITAYDPFTAPLSPDSNLTASPEVVYMTDLERIASSRFFVGHHLLPSQGFGEETAEAVRLIRITVGIMDRNIRVTRMLPQRTIYLESDRFDRDWLRFSQVFDMLKDFDPGIGLNNDKPTLLGFNRYNGEVVDLIQHSHRKFPDLVFKYNGSTPTLRYEISNPELFYEYRDQISSRHAR